MASVAPEPLDPNFRIALPDFEGPLDLLLHLIKTHELDIMDLPVAFVTEKYLEYLGLMQSLNLDVASEYLLMAATLAYIKSRTLLPQEPGDEGEDAEVEQDPRGELIRRLLEYQKYKEAAATLERRPQAGRDVFFRGAPPPSPEGPAPLANPGLYKLLDAFHQVLQRAHRELAFEVTAERLSVQDRIAHLTGRLSTEKRLPFTKLFDVNASVHELVVTFLAVLEMVKLRLLRVHQAQGEGEIHLESRIEEVGQAEGILMQYP